MLAGLLPTHRSLIPAGWALKALSAVNNNTKAIVMSLPEIEAALCEFCEAIIHELLYQRQIYSSDLFERHRLYDVVVRRSRHLKLNDYIHSVVHSIRVNACPIHLSLTSATQRVLMLALTAALCTPDERDRCDIPHPQPCHGISFHIGNSTTVLVHF